MPRPAPRRPPVPPHTEPLRGLTRRFTQPQFEAAIESLVARARSVAVRDQRRCVTQLVNGNAAHLDAFARASLRDEAVRRLQEQARAAAATPPGAGVPPGAYKTVEEACVLLRQRKHALLKTLAQPEGRRDLGWPRYLFGQFYIPAAACDSDRAAEHLARQPLDEPAAIAASLPPWCRRQAPRPMELMAAQDAAKAPPDSGSCQPSTSRVTSPSR